MPVKQEVQDRVVALSLEHRQMLANALDVLSQCFGEKGGKSLLVFSPPTSDMAQIFILNCNEADAYDLSKFAQEHIETMVTAGMPDKEMLN